MILKRYTIAPTLLEAFENSYGPGDCEALAAMIHNKAHPMEVIDCMREMVDCEALENIWQKTQKGSVENLTCGIGKFEHNVDEVGSPYFFRTYDEIDQEVWINHRVPSRLEWDCMTGVADVLIDAEGRWKGEVRPERYPLQSPIPDREEWAQILRGNLLYPRRNKKDEWVLIISKEADMEELVPLVAARTCGRSPSPGYEIPLDRYQSASQMPPVFPLANRDRHDFRSQSPSTESKPRSYQIEDMPAQEPSRYLHPPRSRSPSLELRSGRLHGYDAGDHSHPRSRSQERYRRPHDKKSTQSFPKKGQKKGEICIWRKPGEVGFFRRKK